MNGPKKKLLVVQHGTYFPGYVLTRIPVTYLPIPAPVNTYEFIATWVHLYYSHSWGKLTAKKTILLKGVKGEGEIEVYS